MPGFYGKLPSHGDFLQRAVSDDFVNRWDAWLQEGMACSRRALGDAWLDLFLTSPLWRFTLASGVIGGPVWAGILLPSVDRVGRYFPLTVVAELPPGRKPFEVAVAGNAWFDWAEARARRALDEDLADVNRLEEELRDSDSLLAALRSPVPPSAAGPPAFAHPAAQWYALPADGDMGRFFAHLAAALVPAPHEPLGLWWSVGSERVAPCVLMTRGLPPARLFLELLGGSAPAAAASPAGTVGAGAPVAPPASGGRWRSAAVTDAGRVRDENQDAYVERCRDGVWLVADGMGGHQGGRMASQLLAQHVGRVAVDGDAGAVAQAVREAILAANAELNSRRAEQLGFDGGSTVVAVCACGSEAIALWAGDSRLYRWRAGELERLTRDHSVAEENAGSAPGEAHMLTRAVAGAEPLVLDERRFDLRPGDRLLLCSDGLYGDLEPWEIAAWLAETECAAAARGLLGLALARGGSDNATAVVIAVEGVDAGG